MAFVDRDIRYYGVSLGKVCNSELHEDRTENGDVYKWSML